MSSPSQHDGLAADGRDEIFSYAVDSSRSTSETQEIADEDLRALFALRIGMARGRSLKISMLRDQLVSLEQDYLRTRALVDGQMQAQKRLRFENFLAMEFISGDPLAPEVQLQKARFLFRQAAVSWLLANYEEIEKKFRMEASILGKDAITYQEILKMIFKEIPAQITELLSSETLSLLKSFVGSPFGNSFDLYQLCQDYPHLTDLEVNIYNREDLERFQGHLLGTLSGVGKNVWENYQRKKTQLARELKEYGADRSALPEAHHFGRLREPMRIFLIREQLHASVEKAVAGNNGETEKTVEIPRQLLEHFDYFGRKAESGELAERFHSLPVQSVFWDALQRVLGQATPRRMIAQLSDQIEKEEALLEKIYQLMQLVNSLEKMSGAGLSNDECRGLASIFGRDLKQILEGLNKQKQPAADHPLSVERQLDETLQLAAYTHKQLQNS